MCPIQQHGIYSILDIQSTSDGPSAQHAHGMEEFDAAGSLGLPVGRRIGGRERHCSQSNTINSVK